MKSSSKTPPHPQPGHRPVWVHPLAATDREDGRTALMFAILSSTFDALAPMLRVTPLGNNDGATTQSRHTNLMVDFVNLVDRQGYSALAHAVVAVYKQRPSPADLSKYADAVRLLLSAKADPNLTISAPDPITGVEGIKTTLLLFATKCGERSHPLVKLLLEYGASADLADAEGATPLMWALASVYGKDKTGSRVLKKPPDTDLALAMIRKSASVNEMSNSGLSALHLAVDARDLSVVQLLLRNQADPNGSVTPFSPINSQTSSDTKPFFNANIEDPFSQGGGGASVDPPLIRALASRQEDMVRLLVQSKANANVRDGTGVPAMIRAMMPPSLGTGGLGSSGSSGAATTTPRTLIQLLMQAMGDPNLSSTLDGTTPLIFAAQRGVLDCAQTLLGAPTTSEEGKRANQSLCDDSGRNALMWAAIKGHTNVVQLLMDHMPQASAPPANVALGGTSNKPQSGGMSTPSISTERKVVGQQASSNQKPIGVPIETKGTESSPAKKHKKRKRPKEGDGQHFALETDE